MRKACLAIVAAIVAMALIDVFVPHRVLCSYDGGKTYDPAIRDGHTFTCIPPR